MVTAMVVIIVLAVLWHWGPGFAFGYYVARAQSLMSPAEAYAVCLIADTLDNRVKKAAFARSVSLWAETDPRGCARHLCDTWVNLIGQSTVMGRDDSVSVEEARAVARSVYVELERAPGPLSRG